MKGRPTDHRNVNLTQLNRAVIRGTSGGRIIWQPRILCWYADRTFRGEALPAPFTGMDQLAIHRELGCSARYLGFDGCLKRVHDPRVREHSRSLNALETEHSVETPVGRVTMIERANTSNGGRFPVKWWVTTEEDLKVFTWLEEHSGWAFDDELYRQGCARWGDLGLPSLYLPRVNIQHLYIELMGVEAAVYALGDWPRTVARFFHVLSESHERALEVMAASPIEIINFGDNLHGGLLPPELFVKYVLPEYQKRNDILHRAGKFTHAHWDGDTRPLLPYARECGLDGIEAITPKPQGDVTVEEIKQALGDEVFLLDGIAALLFEDRFPLEDLERQAKKVIELFAPKLVLGISDEISSMGNLERIRFVGDIVDDYNASLGG